MKKRIIQIGGHTLIIQLEEAKRTLQGMRGDIAELGNALKIEKITEEAEELEQKTLVPNFWDDAENSSKILRELKQIKDTIEEYENLQIALEDAIMLADMGIEESGLDRLIKASYSLLGLISFLTAGPDECRAWTIRRGTKAPKAAGKIHSDIERGFIRAEVLAFDDLKKYGSMNAAREAGVLRSEGKEYIMQDGDIVFFRFNV